MKKICKCITALFLAAAVFFSELPLNSFIIEADAADKLTSAVSYKDDGTAVVTFEASDFFNQVRYTTDGSVPDMDSKLYLAPIEITEKTTVRAAEFAKNGKKIYGVKRTVSPKTGKITFSVKQKDGEAVVYMFCATEDAEIRYTVDGSKPDQKSELYTGGIKMSKDTKIRARAYKSGCKTTTTYVKTVRIDENEPAENEEEPENNGKDEENGAAPDPVKTSEKINYKYTYMAEKGYTYVTFLPIKSSNTIYYTTDGSTPAKSSKKYSKRIRFDEYTQLRAREYNKAGEVVATLVVNVKIKCAPVEFTCTDIAVGTKKIVLSSDTEGADIYYTIDGTTPDPEYSQLYTEPITMGDMTSIRAVAVRKNYVKSAVKHTMAYEVPLIIPDLDYDDPVFREVADIVNSYRAANGLNRLILDDEMIEAANVRARELLVINDHERPAGGYYTSVFSERNINVNMSGEFIATYHKTPRELVDNLLSNNDNQIMVADGYNFNSIGVGYYKYGKSIYWVILIAERT